MDNSQLQAFSPNDEMKAILDISAIFADNAGKYIDSLMGKGVAISGSEDTIVIRACLRILIAAISHYDTDIRPAILGNILLELTDLVLELQKNSEKMMAQDEVKTDESQGTLQ